MAKNRHLVSISRWVTAFALLFLSIGGLLFYIATNRLESARRHAADHSAEVHLSTRIFFDWLSIDAANRKLDELTLRRVALLNASRAKRLQGIAGLTILVGILLLLLSNAARNIREGVVRLPDQSPKLMNWSSSLPRANDKRNQPLRGRHYRYNLELLRQPSG